MYKKEVKSFDNPYGIKEVDKVNVDKHIVYFSVPFGNSRGINGYLNKLLYLLRLRHGEDINSGLDLSQVDYNLYCDSKPDIKSFYPILESINNNNIEYAKNIFRNITFVSYCDGNNKLLNIILALHDELMNRGFSESETKEIMSNISVLQVVDNLYYENGSFPYVSTITFHIRQDSENLEWIDDDIKPRDEEFSKAIVEQIDDNREIVIVDSFGENSLTVNEEHSFTKDYILFPVMNALLSICLVNSIDRKDNSFEYYNEGIDYILKKAYEYEEKIGKDLDTLTIEERDDFSKYMMNLMTKYVQKLYSVNDIDFDDINKKIGKEKEISKVSFELNTNYISNIIYIINDLLTYKNYDMGDVAQVRIGNNYMERPVGEAVEILYKNLVREVDNKVSDISNISLDTDDAQLKLDLIAWKKRKINSIYELLDDGELISLLDKYGIEHENKKRI